MALSLTVAPAMRRLWLTGKTIAHSAGLDNWRRFDIIHTFSV
ncbi:MULTISPECIES: hypothetical protein [unclassified Bradyrhizobium]|nr:MULTISPECIES: hypothetical protein [unclassified Bradyrhizobium]